MLLKVADEPFLSDSTYNGKHSAKSSKLCTPGLSNKFRRRNAVTDVHLWDDRWMASCNAEWK